jgi:polyisoprenoid-binding protein YceI
MTTTKWNLDSSHTEIGFRVKHMMLTNISGKFQNFEGSLERYDNSFDNASITFTSEVSSLNTGNQDRDVHLLSTDFFDAEQYPNIIFISRSFKKNNDKEFLLEGDLTMHGIKRAISLQAEFEGINQDPWGNTRAGFNMQGKLNRKDWGLTWNSLLETGGMMVGEDITLNVQLQFIQK